MMIIKVVINNNDNNNRDKFYKLCTEWLIINQVNMLLYINIK